MLKTTKNLKLRFFLSMLLSTILLSACSEPDYQMFNGSSGNIENLKGKWVVINYWADWCPPCIKEMPELSAFYNDNKERVTVFAYNFDRLEGEELQQMLIRFKVGVPSILSDPGELFGWEAPPSLPTTYIVDPQGNMKVMLVGPQTKEKLEMLIDKYKGS
ncbi:MAG TPA: TlpA family protein disulfide reductase [Gammaproteobacteria bacterium]|nr:TlpA family protein disulfide reductase [Gammaproteobacteria bacterium]